MDPSSIPSGSDFDLLSPHYDSYDLSSRFYVHHMGCALVQPICEGKGRQYVVPDSEQALKVKDLTGSVSNPLDTSTPAVSPRKIEDEDDETDFSPAKLSKIKCGFYWYRNFLLPKQKNVPAAVLARHDSLMAEFVGLCSNKDGQLLELCSKLFFK